MVALLMFAVGSALGLFFGWLLHRERVERALYEDVVRNRDRATATLAETSARLELANKDMVRLRSQLTTAQHDLRERDAMIVELEQELAELDAERDDVDPDAADIWDADDIDGEDITEEVLVVDANAGAGDPEGDGGAHAAPPPQLVPAEDVASASHDGSVNDVVVAGVLVADEPESDEPVVVDVADAEVVGVGESDEPVVVDVADAGDVAETAGVQVDGALIAADPVVHAGDGAEPVPTGEPVVVGAAGADLPTTDVPADDLGQAATVAHGAQPSDEADAQTDPTQVVDDAGIGEPLVLEDPVAVPTGSDARASADTADTAEVDDHGPDDLQRINGVGPALERMLVAEGVTTFRQLARLDDADIVAIGERSPRLATRLRRGGWVAQARRLHYESYGTHP